MCGPGVSPLSKKVSGQVRVLQRLLSLTNEAPEALGFDLARIMAWPPIRNRKPPRDSVRTALVRFCHLGIAVSPGLNAEGHRLWKIKNQAWAVAYIERDPDRPWLPLTPTPPTDGFLEFDEHRDHFDITMTQDSFKTVQRYGTENRNQWTWRHKAFTISVNGSSLMGQIFIKPYWRSAILASFGQGFLDYLVALETKGSRRGDFCLPIDMKGQRFTIGGRPVQFSASHYPAQVDVRRSQGDVNIKEGLEAMTKQWDFNVRVLDQLAQLTEALVHQGDIQTRMSESLVQIAKVLTQPRDAPYEAPAEDPGDQSYR